MSGAKKKDIYSLNTQIRYNLLQLSNHHINHIHLLIKILQISQRNDFSIKYSIDTFNPIPIKYIIYF